MLDMQHFPGNLNNQRTQVFIGNSASSGGQWQTWVKPKGINWVHIYLVGKGGNGGNGAVGANSTAAGGGGGGSGAQTSVLVPAWCLPDTLFLSLAGVSSTSAISSYVTMYPVTSSATYTVASAGGGGNGGNAAGATAGAAGTAGTGATQTSMVFASAIGVWTALAGQAGIIGGTNVSGGALSMPVSGIKVTGGTGGGGLPAAAATGTAGGGISGVGPYPAIAAAAGQATATLPPNTPDGGFIFQSIISNVFGMMNYGGLGSGSTHGTATGGGLVQRRGGDGAPGCGGGGSGGALTGSTAATGGNGGPAFCIISCWG